MTNTVKDKNSGINKALKILAYLRWSGVEDVIICPGGRNASFVEVLSKTNLFNSEYYFEERSASFYALGLCKKNNIATAVITTSGTAVAETLPAVIEAHYQGLPLVVVSADRPKNYRGSGAPQSIAQDQLLTSFCGHSFDLEDSFNELKSLLPVNLPSHINVCFDEPLLGEVKKNYDEDINIIIDSFVSVKKTSEKLPEDLAVLNVQEFDKKTPLIILGALSKKEAEFVLPEIIKTGLPIYAEAHSQLKSHPQLKHQLLNINDQQVIELFKNKQFNAVIRLGGVPILKFWRLLENLSDIPIVNYSKVPYSGVPRIKQQAYCLKDFKNINQLSFNKVSISNIIDTQIKKTAENSLNREELFLSELSKQIDNKAHIFLGNSLPIREWDKVAQVHQEQLYTSLRGANGIDGNIAYFYGLCEHTRKNYCIIGDLTALYDLPSGFINNQILKSQIDFKIIIINNGGGKIFNKLFENRNFENSHDLNFKGWAEMLKLSYQKISDPQNLKNGLQGHIIELEI